MRVVVTRAAHQAEELASPLRALGFDVILLPAIAISPPADPEPLRRAAENADTYDWIIFTSVNAVEAFTSRLTAIPVRTGIATVGLATRDAAQAKGFLVTITPEKYVAESLLASFAAEDLNGRRVLIPSAAVTRDLIPPELRKRGALVDVVEAYRNVLPADLAQQARLIFREPYPDCVLFASSSAVENLVALIGDDLRRTKSISIGPATSATLRKHHLEPYAEASEHTVTGLIAACVMMQTGR